MVAPEILKRFPFFADMNESELKSLSIIASEVYFQRGDLIFEEDKPADTLYLVLDGWVDIMISTDTRGTHRELVTTRTSGDIFGWSAVVEPYLYTASAVCASPVKAIGFDGSSLLALLALDTRLCCLIMTRICQVSAERLRAARLQMVSLFMVH
jgi:CRP-like cAMP-binding protein